MAGINEELPFYPLNIAVLTISDTRDETTDTSGGLLVERLTTAGHVLKGKAIVHDEVEAIRAQLKVWIADPDVDVVLTTATLQSRALAGQADDTFVFCVPGSTGACRDAWDLVLAEELDSRFRPCSLVGQIPRYRGICP